MRSRIVSLSSALVLLPLLFPFSHAAPAYLQTRADDPVAADDPNAPLPYETMTGGLFAAPAATTPTAVLNAISSASAVSNEMLSSALALGSAAADAPLPYETTAPDLINNYAAFNPSAQFVAPPSVGTPPKAVYFQTNNVEGQNEIVALCIAENGTISSHTKTPTKGRGCAGLSSYDGQPMGPDTLFSQNSVLVSGNYLFTVNAGSNSVTMFSINPENPSILTMVGQPANTLGNFPVALAYSPEHKSLCVANAGQIDGITCFNVSCNGLTTRDTAPRSINTGQRLPEASGPEGTVSDILFTPDQKNLIVFIKGTNSYTAIKKPTVIDVYPVKNGRVGKTCTRSELSGGQYIFGVASVGANKFVACDAARGITQLEFNPKTRKVCSVPEGDTTIDFMGSVRKLAYNSKTDSVYVTDLNQGRIIEFDSKNSTRLAEQYPASNQPGNTDITSAGDFLYALSPINVGYGGTESAVQVLNVPEKNKVTNVETYIFKPEDGITKYAMGMAAYGA